MAKATLAPAGVMQVTEKLRSVGLRATPQRRAVLGIFEANGQRYLNAEAVYREATSHDQSIGRATVYRTLSQLAEVGILVRSTLDPDSGVAFYRLHGKEHVDVLVCVSCDRAQEFRNESFESRSRTLAESNGFTLRRYQLLIYGYCPNCRAAAAAGAEK